MDVKPAKAPAPANLPVSPQPLPVRQAPAQPVDEAAPAASQPDASVPDVAPTETPAATSSPKVGHRAPVGIIVVTLCFMLGLAAVATAIYLKSR